jgi:hypothetical protein
MYFWTKIILKNNIYHILKYSEIKNYKKKKHLN